MDLAKPLKKLCPDCTSGFYSMELNGIITQMFCEFTTDGVAQPSCNSIKNQCPTCETNFYYTEGIGGVQGQVFCKIENGAVSDGSCKSIKEHCPQCSSGFYGFEILGGIFEAFCDMLVAGGKETVFCCWSISRLSSEFSYKYTSNANQMLINFSPTWNSMQHEDHTPLLEMKIFYFQSLFQWNTTYFEEFFE